MSRERRRYHHGDLREALIRAVFDVAAREGLSAIKVSALARECGVSSAAPFKHFPSREALLVAAAERAADDQLAAMSAAATVAPNPLEAERARAVAYVRWAVTNPGPFRLLEESGIITASERLRAQSLAFREQLDAVVGADDRAPDTPRLTQRSAAALAAQSLIYGLAKMCVDGSLGPVTPDEAAQLAREVTGVLGTGLANLGEE